MRKAAALAGLSRILPSKSHPRSVLEEPAEPCHLPSNRSPSYILLTKLSVTHSGQELLHCSGSPSSQLSASSKSVACLTGLVSSPLFSIESAICASSCPSVARRSTAFPEDAGALYSIARVRGTRVSRRAAAAARKSASCTLPASERTRRSRCASQARLPGRMLRLVGWREGCERVSWRRLVKSYWRSSRAFPVSEG